MQRSFMSANQELRNALEELNNVEIVSKAKQMGIDWTFNPPAAPNMGGVLERLVRTVKTALNIIF
jgi:hypothetical protein